MRNQSDLERCQYVDEAVDIFFTGGMFLKYLRRFQKEGKEDPMAEVDNLEHRFRMLLVKRFEIDEVFARTYFYGDKTMEEILASIKKIIDDDEHNETQNLCHEAVLRARSELQKNLSIYVDPEKKKIKAGVDRLAALTRLRVGLSKKYAREQGVSDEEINIYFTGDTKTPSREGV